MSADWGRTLDDGADAGGYIVPPSYRDGVHDVFGVDLAAVEGGEPSTGGDEFTVSAWLDEDAVGTFESFLIAVEVDGRDHSMQAAFVHVKGLPFLGSDSPAALRALALHAAELADRLEARHTPGAHE